MTIKKPQLDTPITSTEWRHRSDWEQGLKIKECNGNGQILYKEYYNGVWHRYTYNEKGLDIRCDRNDGLYYTKEYNSAGQLTDIKWSDGTYKRSVYDDQGRCIEMEHTGMDLHERYEYVDNKIITYQLDYDYGKWIPMSCMSL